MYSWIQSALRVNSAEFGLISPTPPFSTDFYYSSLFTVSLSSTFHSHIPALLQLLLTDLPYDEIRCKKQGSLKEKLCMTVHTLSFIQNAKQQLFILLLFGHTRYMHDVSFSINAEARDHVSFNKSPKVLFICPSSRWQINRSEHRWQ